MEKVWGYLTRPVYTNSKQFDTVDELTQYVDHT